MRNAALLGSILILGLGGCTASAPEQSVVGQPFAQRCEQARTELDKAVEEGQLEGLRGLKQDIELYCVWRRN